MISYLLVFIKKYIPGSNVYFVLLLFDILQPLDFIHRQQKPFTVMFVMSWEKIMFLKYHYDYLHWWDFKVNRKCTTSKTWQYLQKEKCSSSKDLIITYVRIFVAIRCLLLSGQSFTCPGIGKLIDSLLWQFELT